MMESFPISDPELEISYIFPTASLSVENSFGSQSSCFISKLDCRMSTKSRVAGKSIVVTGLYLAQRKVVQSRLTFLSGGASGIGLAIIQSLAPSSNRFAILDISSSTAESQINTLKAEYPTSSFSFHICDISNWEEQAAAFKHAYQAMGSIDIVFANAGVVEIGKFLETSDDEPAKPNLRCLDINLVGTLYSKSSYTSQDWRC